MVGLDEEQIFRFAFNRMQKSKSVAIRYRSVVKRQHRIKSFHADFNVGGRENPLTVKRETSLRGQFFSARKRIYHGESCRQFFFGTESRRVVQQRGAQAQPDPPIADIFGKLFEVSGLEFADIVGCLKNFEVSERILQPSAEVAQNVQIFANARRVQNFHHSKPS